MVNDGRRALLEIDKMIEKCHGGNQFHRGVRATWLKLNGNFPAHGIPIEEARKYIDDRCAHCAQVRIRLRDQLRSVKRHLKVVEPRSMVGIDTLGISPTSVNGYKYLIVMTNFFSRICMLYRSKEKDVNSIVCALIQWVSNKGLFDCLRSDPGSDLMSNVVKELNNWLGIRHSVSLVDSPRSNGVEPVNKRVLGLLKDIVHDKRVMKEWDDVRFLSLVQFEINASYHSEVGAIPFEVEMGSQSQV